MEICILKFESNHGAEEALREVIDSEGDRTPWLHDVAMVARPLVGRVRIGATYPDGKSKAVDELRKRLEELHRRMAQELLQFEAEGAPATH
jgi:hypothetical protein